MSIICKAFFFADLLLELAHDDVAGALGLSVLRHAVRVLQQRLGSLQVLPQLGHQALL